MKLILGANELELIVPGVLRFSSTHTMFVALLAMAKSAFPSPLRYASAMLTGSRSAANSILDANVMLPVLRKMDTVWALRLATARSGRLSPSKSPTATSQGPPLADKSVRGAKLIAPGIEV